MERDVDDQFSNGFTVGDWEVRPSLNRLCRGDEIRLLEPKVMDLLVFFARHAGEVISRQQILASVWPGVVVCDETLSRAISVLRTSLGDLTTDPRYLKTLAKRGYCLIAEAAPLEAPATSFNRILPGVTAIGLCALLAMVFMDTSRNRPEPVSGRPPGAQASAGLPGRPVSASVAVLPFADLSPGGDQAYFADGIAEEVLDRVSRLQGLYVVGRTSSFSFRNQVVDLPTIGEQLMVTHILEGSVRKVGDQVRITVQLLNTTNGYHVWSQRFERHLTDVFAVQDEIATAVVQSLSEFLGVGAAPVADPAPPPRVANEVWVLSTVPGWQPLRENQRLR